VIVQIQVLRAAATTCRKLELATTFHSRDISRYFATFSTFGHFTCPTFGHFTCPKCRHLQYGTFDKCRHLTNVARWKMLPFMSKMSGHVKCLPTLIFIHSRISFCYPTSQLWQLDDIWFMSHHKTF
jgi:hypothetical protein